MTGNIILIIFLAVGFANLPWISEQFYLAFPPPGKRKREWMRLLEWLSYYLLVGLVAMGLEKKTHGGLHAQDWEFYVTTLSLFAVCAFPGFIYRHQLLHMLSRK